MANNDNNKNNDTQSRPRNGFNATAFIKKQLERNKPAEGTKPASEVVSFPITSEPQPLPIRDKEIKPDIARSEIMKHYLGAAQEHLASGAVWEAVGVYRAVLKLDPENLAVRQQLVDILLKTNAKPDAVKELISLAELYQKQENADAAQQTYQKILVLDPENQVAKSALAIPEEEVPLVKEPESVSVSAPESILEPIIEEKPGEPVISVTLEPPATELVKEEVQEPSPAQTEQEIVTEPVSTPPVALVSEPTPITEPGVSEPQAEPIPESPNGKLEYYRKKLDQDAKNIEARLGYINAYLEIGLEFELVPDYLALAEAYLEKGGLDTAEKTYRHILSLEPDQPGATQGLVTVNQNRAAGGTAPAPTATPAEPVTEESKEAKLIENYRRILQLNPLNSEIAHRLAAIYQERNQPEIAVTELQQLADAYMQRTMYTQAIKVYNESLAIAPKNQEVQTKLEKAEELRQSMTAIESAIKSYKSGLDYGPIKRSS